MANMSDANPNHERSEQLVRLLVQHQQDLFRYIFSLMPDEDDARDLLQETSLALFRKADEYDASQPFLAWAFGFAYLEILKLRKRKASEDRILRDDIVRLLSEDRHRQTQELNQRLEALEQCLQALPPNDLQLVRARYISKLPIDQIAAQFGASRRSLFRALDRTRRMLLECINKRIDQPGKAC